MKEIQLTRGQVALVDDEDFEWLSEWKWYAMKGTVNKTFYAERTTRIGPRKENKQIHFKMHNVIWEHHYGPVPEGSTIDHASRDSLNDKKSNLRLATRSQQMQNKNIQINNTSGYIGINFNKVSNKYQAQIQIDGKKIFLGYFIDPAEAARVRDQAAILYFGEFAALNFPESRES